MVNIVEEGGKFWVTIDYILIWDYDTIEEAMKKYDELVTV